VSGDTTIGWCDATFNPWWGCERVSPGCAHCYADTWAKRVGEGGLWSDGAGAEHRIRHSSDQNWRQPLVWAEKARAGLLPNGKSAYGRRPRVFCSSMADVFEPRKDLGEPRERLFALIAATPELDWLVLTKRPEYAKHILAAPMFWLGVNGHLLQMAHEVLPGSMGDWASGRSVLPNVWLGTSIENARHTYRARLLASIPAALRFVSAEPLLGSLYPELGPGVGQNAVSSAALTVGELERPGRAPLDLTGIGWVIAGGESGPHARPHRLAWTYEVVQACKDAQVPVFVKQLGAKPMATPELFMGEATVGLAGGPVRPTLAAVTLLERPLRLQDRKGEDPSEWPDDLRWQEWPRSPAAAT